MSEADAWIPAQKKLANGKVDVRLLVAEGQKRGYCICPKPMRQLVNFDGLTCEWCQMPETPRSSIFWYGGNQPGEERTIPVEELPHGPAGGD